MTMPSGGIQSSNRNGGDEMRLDFEQRILRNPALGALLLWELSRSFQEYEPNNAGPSLPVIVVSAGMLLHRPTVLTIKGMQLVKGIGLARAIASEPEIVAGLQQRVEAAFAFSMDSLGLATASGLVVAIERQGRFPTYQATRQKLSPRLEAASRPIVPQLSASRRLGAWFAADQFAVSCAHLQLRF
jgi:Family of unknown function (DUF6521)